MADIREEDFSRLQAQIIELRTTNYDVEVKYQRQNSECEQLREKSSQLEKELEKSSKIIQKSKNKKEYALLLEENEGLQQRLRDHEEDFKLQNKTLLEEVNRIEDENKKLVEEIKNLKTGKGDNGSSHEAELRRLKAENSALQKSLKNTQELYEAEVVRFRKNEEETSCGHSTLDCKKLKKNSEGSGNCEDVKDENSLTKGTDEKQQKLSTEEKIEEELVNIITSTFETFCISLREDNRTDGKCTEELENYGEISETQETTSGEKDRKNNCWQCSDEDFSSLKENIVGKVQSLLENRDICLKSKFEINENKADEGIAHMKHSTQLTELHLNLATEREEKKLLEEQLQNLEGNLKREISKLEEEVQKLTEKAKRKQESFTQLQDEKENLYNENRKAIDEMKQSHLKEVKLLTDQTSQLSKDLEASRKELAEYQLISEHKIKDLNEKLVAQENQATSNVEETIQELDNARIENSSLCEQLHSLQEACESYRNENEDQKAMLIGIQNTMKELEKREVILKLDNEKLKSEVEESGLRYEHLRRQMDEMMNEKEQYLQSTNEATKLAEKRKQMLDEFSIEQQKTVTEHKQQMNKMETSYKEEAKKNQDEYKRTIEDLKTQLQGEKKLKKELEEKQQKLSDVTTQLTAIESKCGWFERRLTETEEILRQEKEQASETIKELKKQHDLNMNETYAKHLTELKELSQKIKVMEEEKREQMNVIEKYKQDIKDKDVENVIAGKKGDQLVKDLKRQLKSERKKTELLQQRLQEAVSENRARENFEKLFDPNVSRENTRRNSGDSSMLSVSSLTFDNQEISPDASINISVNDETTDLISRVADLQQEKWQLEERVRHLEENCSAMAEDLMRKSAVIQHYAMETKLDSWKEVTTNASESNFKSRVKGTFNIGKQEELLKDMNKKLQRMLEETLMKNIQMQKDMDILTQENTSNRKESSSDDNDGRSRR